MAEKRKGRMERTEEYPFDFERYIEERLREIEDLDERRFAKKVLLDGLGKMVRCMEERYERLEGRLAREAVSEENQYGIAMTVIRREHYDPTNQTLYPVDERDLDPERLARELSDENHSYLFTVFLEADDETQRIFEAGKSPGSGWQSQERRLHISRARRYREAVEGLYQVFQDNSIPWETVNTAYLDKFYDVYVEVPGTEAEEKSGKDPGKGPGKGTESIKTEKIWFGEFEERIRYEFLPLWNLEQFFFDGTDFMLPCMDGIYYEHEFLLNEKEEGDGYLIQSNEDILEIRHEEGKIILKSEKETFEDWKVLHIIGKEPLQSLDYDYSLLTNRRKDSFLRRRYGDSCNGLLTRAELFRRIMELDIQEFIEVQGYEISKEGEAYPAGEGMDWFEEEGLFPLDSRKILVLKFREIRPGHYLNSSMVRYAISRIQREVGEYRCVGVLV